MAYNMVDRVLMVVFHTFLYTFCVVTNRVVFDFFNRSSPTRRGLSLTITSTRGQICCEVFSSQPLLGLRLV